MQDEVLNFLQVFTGDGERQQVCDTFTGGCCYWVVYDITGDVTGFYDWHAWDDLEDDALRSRIVRDCINF